MLVAMSETISKIVVKREPLLVIITPQIKTLVKDVFLAGLIQGGFERNVNLD
jgi:hypothetical protein